MQGDVDVEVEVYKTKVRTRKELVLITFKFNTFHQARLLCGRTENDLVCEVTSFHRALLRFPLFRFLSHRLLRTGICFTFEVFSWFVSHNYVKLVFHLSACLPETVLGRGR